MSGRTTKNTGERRKYSQRLRRDPFFAMWFGAFFGAITGYLLNYFASLPPCAGWLVAQVPVIRDLLNGACVTGYLAFYSGVVLLFVLWILDYLLPRMIARAQP